METPILKQIREHTIQPRLSLEPYENPQRLLAQFWDLHCKEHNNSEAAESWKILLIYPAPSESFTKGDTEQV